MDISIIKTVTDWIPKIIVGARDIIIKGLDLAKLDSNTIWPIIALIVGGILSFYFIKQWVTFNIFTKLKTILPWILITLLIYCVLVYVQ